MSESIAMPTGREVRQLFGQLCDQAADVAAAFRPCTCSENVRATAWDGREGVNAPRLDPIPIQHLRESALLGSDLSDEALMGKLARLESQIFMLNQLTSPGDGLTKNTGNIGPNTEACGPLTLMRLPSNVRSMIWWQAMRPESGFVNIVPWARTGYATDRNRFRIHLGRFGRGRFHRARTALIDRKQNPFSAEIDPESLQAAQSWQRQGEHFMDSWTSGWALLYINKQIYEEAEAAYWKGVVDDGLMLSFGCGGRTGDYWGVATARTFFNDHSTPYLRTIQRVHLDLSRPDRDDGPNGYGGQAIVLQRAGVQTVNFARNLGGVLDILGNRLAGLRHLSLTLGGWVPDIRQTPWIEDTDYPNTRLQSSQQWVTRLRNITSLTRLRLRVMYAPRDPATINPKLDQDPGVQRTIHFMSMLRGSMLVKGDELGVGNMTAWANKRYLEFATADRFRIVVQCDDSWDEENNEHHHHVEDEEYDPAGGLNNFGDQFSWDPIASI